MNVTKTVIIAYIASCLESGEKRGKILGKVEKKWAIPRSTFDRRLKEAKEQVAAKLNKVKNARDSVDIQNAIKEREMEIASVNERKTILTKIIRGDLKLYKPYVVAGKIKKQLVVPDWTDRKNAISELNKMEGDYAPDKVANVTTDGQDIKQTPQLSNAQFTKLIKAINETGTGKS